MLDQVWLGAGQDEEAGGAHGVTYEAEAALVCNVEHLSDHGCQILGSQLMNGKAPELSLIKVRIQAFMFPTIFCAPEVAHPDIIASLSKDECQAIFFLGHPAKRGAEHTVLQEHHWTPGL